MIRRNLHVTWREMGEDFAIELEAQGDEKYRSYANALHYQAMVGERTITTTDTPNERSYPCFIFEVQRDYSRREIYDIVEQSYPTEAIDGTENEITISEHGEYSMGEHLVTLDCPKNQKITFLFTGIRGNEDIYTCVYTTENPPPFIAK